jgi:hypothetical protein
LVVIAGILRYEYAARIVRKRIRSQSNLVDGRIGVTSIGVRRQRNFRHSCEKPDTGGAVGDSDHSSKIFTKKRTLEFPSDSIGWLYLVSVGLDRLWLFGRDDEVAIARATVTLTVPSDRFVVLKANANLVAKPKQPDKLRPDIVDSISIAPPFDEKSLKNLVTTKADLSNSRVHVWRSFRSFLN